MAAKEFKYGWRAIILFYSLVLLIKLGLVLISDTDLDPEEAQYWLWSKYPDWSYYSKPPLIAYINKATTEILGSSTWSVRLNAILFATFISLASYYIVLKLYTTKKMAFFVASGLLFLPAYNYISLFFTTDILVSFFWLLTCYFFWQSLQTNKTQTWILAGFCMGLGLLSKYALLIFIPFSLIYLLVTNRHFLFQRGYYYFLCVALLLFSPVIVWNINHDMVGFNHVSHLAGMQSAPIPWNKVLSYQAEFIGGQFLLNLPLLFVVFFWKKKDYKKYFGGEFERYIMASVSFVFILFFITAFKKRININWLLFSYIPLYIIALKAIWQTGVAKKQNVRIYLALTSFSMLFLFLQPLLNSKLPQIGNIVPAKIDPFRKLVHWKKLADCVDKKVTALTGSKKGYIVFTDKYQIATELTFYGQDKIDSYCIPTHSRRMNQFDLWVIPSFDKDRVGVLVRTQPLEGNTDILDLIGTNNIKYISNFEAIYKDELVHNYYIYILYHVPSIKNYKKAFVKY